MSEQIVRGREVQVELAHERRVEGYSLELDNHVSAELQVVEEQVDVEVMPADLEQYLAAHERTAGSELEQEALDLVNERLLDLAFPAFGRVAASGWR